MYHQDRPIPVQPFVEHQINQLSGLTEEQRDDCLSLVSILVNERSATTLQSQLLLLEVACAMLEGTRGHALRRGHVANMQVTAAEIMFRKLDNGGSTSDDEIAAKARRYKTDPAFCDETRTRLEEAGYSADAIELEAERQSLDTMLQIERVAGAATRRLHVALKSLDMVNPKQGRMGK